MSTKVDKYQLVMDVIGKGQALLEMVGEDGMVASHEYEVVLSLLKQYMRVVDGFYLASKHYKILSDATEWRIKSLEKSIKIPKRKRKATKNSNKGE